MRKCIIRTTWRESDSINDHLADILVTAAGAIHLRFGILCHAQGTGAVEKSERLIQSMGEREKHSV